MVSPAVGVVLTREVTTSHNKEVEMGFVGQEEWAPAIVDMGVGSRNGVA